MISMMEFLRISVKRRLISNWADSFGSLAGIVLTHQLGQQISKIFLTRGPLLILTLQTISRTIVFFRVEPDKFPPYRVAFPVSFHYWHGRLGDLDERPNKPFL